MSEGKVVIVRIAASTSCPPGFIEHGVTTRRTKLCIKQSVAPTLDAAAAAGVLPAPIPAPPVDPGIDDLAGILGAMTINQPAIVEMTELMAAMGMRGGYRNRRRSTRRRSNRRSSHRSQSKHSNTL